MESDANDQWIGQVTIKLLEDVSGVLQGAVVPPVYSHAKIAGRKGEEAITTRCRVYLVYHLSIFCG